MPRRIAAALLLALFCPLPLGADVLLTKKRDADEFLFQGRASQGAKNQKVEIWIASDRVRRDDGRTALILRLDEQKLYVIDHTDRAYTAIDLRQSAGRWTAKAKDNFFWLDGKVGPAGEKKKVGSWQAVPHEVVLSNEAGTGQRIRLQWWVAPDLKIEDGSLRALLRVLATFSPAGSDWMAAVLDLPGHPVLFERVEKQPDVDIKIREELISVKHGEAPKNAYEPPPGYRLMDTGEYGQAYGLPEAL
jgi:hypothetical protein